MLSGMVAAAILVVQMLVYVPSVLHFHHSTVSQQLQVERNLLAASFAATDEQSIHRVASPLSNTLVGLTIQSPDSGFSLNEGQTFHYVFGGSEPKTSGTIKAAQVTLTTRSTTLEGIAFVETRATLYASLKRMVALSVLAIIVSAIGGFVAILGTTRYYIKPMDDLIAALKVSRENANGEGHATIDLKTDAGLGQIADEFNSLINAQKHSSRQVKVKQQYLEFAAHHDPLTHLPNRLMFENALKATVRSAVADKRHFAVFLVDLDNFKFFNDQYGHLVGDKMVAEVGNRLRTMMRENDLVARLDGDEFVVIQQEAQDETSAEEVAKRIMGVATAPYEYRGFTLKAAVSVGISKFPKDVHINQEADLLGEEIVNNAAVALQEAKSNGKNQYQLFNEKMRSRLTARIHLEQDLKIAMQDSQFEVFYQPKINIHTRQCTGAEALVRWRHPVNGFVSPDAFVPVTEETGMIIELGEWILETACRKTYELQQSGYEGLNVAVNISAVQFTDGNLLPMVARALETTGLSSGSLELEITESAVMHDPEDVISSLHELSKFGMQLAIDDFGTGYSSLAYLKRFPVNTLKIDRAFITDISSDYDDVAIVEAVLGLGKHFNTKVVAEGVEDEEQLSFLKSQGCDIAQGYYISKPLSPERYAAWLERWPYGVQPAAAGKQKDPLTLEYKTGT